MPAAVLDGAEPFSSSQGSNGVLLLHGLTGSPQSLRSLGDRLVCAGFSVELPLLPGHGTVVGDLESMRFADFADAAASSFRALTSRCEKVVVVGLSMGGTLGCVLAGRECELSGLVLINPLVSPPATSMLELLAKAAESGTAYLPSIASDIALGSAREIGYDELPIRTLLSLFEATSDVAVRLDEICCPVLLFSSRTDHVVPTESSDLVEASVGGAVERVVLEHSFHVATLDHDAVEVEDRTVAFCEKVCT